jgi:hypothetical protein
MSFQLEKWFLFFEFTEYGGGKFLKHGGSMLPVYTKTSISTYMLRNKAINS